jgi:acetylornithine deacetylase/succinyl-diaminopimelate desuccinylase-like protein
MSAPLLDRVRRDRLADDLWSLVTVPSPTRQERRVAFLFAELLERAGAAVEVDETIHDSPNVVGRLPGARAPASSAGGPGGGRVIQLAGHLDHIDVPHAAPQRTEDVVSGRGSADMKNGLAGILEIVRVLNETGRDFTGELLVTAYGLHEAPLGDAAGLLQLIRRGVVGNAALVFEGPEGVALVMGKGQSIWNLRISRDGEVCHELRRDPAADELLATVLATVRRLLDHNQSLATAAHEYPLLGPESVFVGQVHYGDFYNRAPAEALLQGTRRWHPKKTFDDVRRELRELVDGLPSAPGISIEDSWIFVGESFAIDAEAEIVGALRDAFGRVTGREMRVAGGSSILDVNRIVPFGKVPAVSVSLDGETGHADHEFVRLERMEEGCRIALQTVMNYLG